VLDPLKIKSFKLPLENKNPAMFSQPIYTKMYKHVSNKYWYTSNAKLKMRTKLIRLKP
jgi:hypothetical protein